MIDKHQRPRREAHPGERIGRISRDQDRDHRGRDSHRQRVEEGLADAGRVQHPVVVLERELGRQRSGVVDAPAAVALERRVGRQLVVAIAVDLQRAFAARQIGDGAGLELTRLGDAHAEIGDAALAVEHIAGNHVFAVHLLLARGQGAAPDDVLLAAGQRGPPAGHGNLVLGAQRGDQDAEGRHRPDDDDHDHRQVDGIFSPFTPAAFHSHVTAPPVRRSYAGCSRS